jgi:hypothetical protein
MEHGYSGIDENSKVRLLLAGITTSNYDVVKSQILDSPALKMSFENSVKIYKDFIKATKKDQHHNCSAVNVKSRHNGKSGGGAGNSRYQSMSLSGDQKEALCQTHLARGHVPNDKKGKTANDGAKSNKAVISALKARVDALVAATGPEVQGTTEGAGNRNNDALRQRPRGPGE